MVGASETRSIVFPILIRFHPSFRDEIFGLHHTLSLCCLNAASMNVQVSCGWYKQQPHGQRLFLLRSVERKNFRTFRGVNRYQILLQAGCRRGMDGCCAVCTGSGIAANGRASMLIIKVFPNLDRPAKFE